MFIFYSRSFHRWKFIAFVLTSPWVVLSLYKVALIKIKFKLKRDVDSKVET